jgi:hypothetical protein
MGKLSRAAVLVATPLLFAGLFSGPAYAHGAPSNPVSRAVACGPEADRFGSSAACKAALAAGGAQAFEAWDNLRIANVNGRDRQVVPDGKLCSGGLPIYRALDLPRADWPATKLTAGSPFTFSYGQTIPHKGTFRMYMTRDGYDAARPLTWDDLEAKPFLTAADPVLKNGAYTMQGTMPRGKSGRHLIYTIWQTNPDTYYSCSDVVFPAASAGGPAGGGAVVGDPAAPRSPAPFASDGEPAAGAPVAGSPAAGAPAVGSPAGSGAAVGGPGRRLNTVSSQSRVLPLAAFGVALLSAAGLVTVFLIRRRRTSG